MQSQCIRFCSRLQSAYTESYLIELSREETFTDGTRTRPDNSILQVTVEKCDSGAALHLLCLIPSPPLQQCIRTPCWTEFILRAANWSDYTEYFTEASKRSRLWHVLYDVCWLALSILFHCLSMKVVPHLVAQDLFFPTCMSLEFFHTCVLLFFTVCHNLLKYIERPIVV